ncbi:MULTISPECIES: DNA gyrase inhibitor YacG [unclassified Bradyrhizobium]|uniref:DNA gyrase inhibitor YacG n=1 Tax=unclassified Bradyrhizobium TaxID=2631580 RepID=UPI00102ECD70|nr:MULTISPECIES: DNA gyrase inhibitor YacG [unclassified Bradyrhizobium]MDI4238992.1 DNA gyrase inhibitor YacG [Bradyrhizobium sp. Arg237L]TAI65664.1 DNA gyrase inhibitor YacG [Bradyrhizobium sp. Leo170]
MPEQRRQAGAAEAPAKAEKPSKTPSRPCPICGKPAEHAFRPFCSARCRDVDLNRWLSGTYIVPGRDDQAEEE